MNTEPHRRKGMQIMGKLIGLVKPLVPVMAAAVLLGTAGYLCAIFLTILAAGGILRLALPALGPELSAGLLGGLQRQPLSALFVLLVVLAVLRGILH